MSRYQPRGRVGSPVQSWGQDARQFISDDFDADFTPWERPSDWLEMPYIRGSQRVALLVRIEEYGGNLIALQAAEDYTVYWGDGTSGSYSASSIAEKEYNWDNAYAETLTSQGFKQAMIIVAPNTGHDLRLINLNVRHSLHTAVGQYYPDAPIMEIAISGEQLEMVELSGNYGPSYPYNVGLNSCYILSLYGKSKITEGNRLCGWNMYGLYQIHIDYEFTSQCTTMNGAFAGCVSLQSISLCDTSSSSDMSYMFESCRVLREIPPFDTSSATTLYAFLWGCNNLRRLPQLDTSNCLDLSYFALYCSNLEEVPLLSTHNVTQFYQCFYQCNMLNKFPVSSMESAINASQAFLGTSIKSVPFLEMNNATSIDMMFYDSQVVECAGINAPNATSAGRVFQYSNLRYIGYCNIPLAQNCSHLFSHTLIEQLPPTFNINAATTGGYMFYRTQLKNINNLNVSQMTNCAYMFADCKVLQEVGSLNISSSQNAHALFYNCLTLRSIPALVTNNVASMEEMFFNCRSIETIPQLNTNSVVNMKDMFNGCRALESIPALNTSAVTDVTSMFTGCVALREIPSLNFVSVTSAGSGAPFVNCLSLRRSSVSNFSWSHSYSTSNRLSQGALKEIYQNLPTVGSAQTIDVTGSWGANFDDTSIATSKGWTVSG